MLFLLSDGAAAADGAGNAGGIDWTMWIGLILLVVVFYFIVIRPSRKQEKEAAAMRDALEVGDEITTIGGIIGEIVSMKEDTITIVTSKAGTKIRFLKSAVRSVDLSAAEKRGEKPAPAAETKPEVKAEPKKAKKEMKKESKASAVEAPAETPAEEPATETPAAEESK